MDRDTAATRAAAFLKLTEHVTVSTSPHSQPPAGYAGPVLQMRKKSDGSWIAQLWPDADTYTVEKAADRPLPIRRVVVTAAGEVTEEALTAASRRPSRSTGHPRGRPRVLPEGQSRSRRIAYVPEPEDEKIIQQLIEAHGLTEAEVTRALVAKALRRKKLPW